ncbi:MAG TPA: glycosyltransferase [Dehalococcoidia bacterium]|nr:glycosyltransferase [Dehalococcoidia bacterium]
MSDAEPGLGPVVLFTNSWMMGGMEQHIVSLGRGLRRRGYRTSLICSSDPVIAPLREACEAEGVEVHALDDARGAIAKVGRLRDLERLLQNYRGGTLHLHLTGPFRGELPMLAGRAAGIRCFVRTEHQPLEEVPPWKDRLWLRVKDHGLDAVICVSGQNAEYHTRDLGRNAARFFTVHNCVDLGRFDPAAGDREGARAELGVAAGSPLIGVVSRLTEERKGISQFLEMAAQLAASCPASRFLVVGDGDLRPRLEAQARELGIGQQTIFTGERKDIPRLLSALDVFVMPSLWEGGPYTLLEAMAMRIPSVTTAVGMVPETVVPREHALVVPPGDVGALARSVGEILTDAELRDHLAESGYQLVHERFSEDNLAEGVIGVYKRVSRRAIHGGFR